MSCAKYRVYPLVKCIYGANSIYIYDVYPAGVPVSYVYIYRVYPVLTAHRGRRMLCRYSKKMGFAVPVQQLNSPKRGFALPVEQKNGGCYAGTAIKTRPVQHFSTGTAFQIYRNLEKNERNTLL